MNYQCPVCGYAKMTDPPRDYYICPCCGTEFGNDDTLYSYGELRLQWIRSGLHWFSRATRQPEGWSPISQLDAAGHGSELLVLSSASSTSEEENRISSGERNSRIDAWAIPGAIDVSIAFAG